MDLQLYDCNLLSKTIIWSNLNFWATFIFLSFISTLQIVNSSSESKQTIKKIMNFNFKIANLWMHYAYMKSFNTILSNIKNIDFQDSKQTLESYKKLQQDIPYIFISHIHNYYKILVIFHIGLLNEDQQGLLPHKVSTSKVS